MPDIDGISIAHGEEKAMEAGMSGFLVKPISTYELLSQVSRSLEEHASS